MPFISNRTDLKRPDLKGQFPCSVCGKIFCHSSSLSRHRMQAHFKSYICTQCNQEISSNETLRSHMYRSHHVSRMFMCRCCNWAFPDKTSLHIHMQSMTKTGTPGEVNVLAKSTCEEGDLVIDIDSANKTSLLHQNSITYDETANSPVSTDSLEELHCSPQDSPKLPINENDFKPTMVTVSKFLEHKQHQQDISNHPQETFPLNKTFPQTDLFSAAKFLKNNAINQQQTSSSIFPPTNTISNGNVEMQQIESLFKNNASLKPNVLHHSQQIGQIGGSENAEAIMRVFLQNLKLQQQQQQQIQQNSSAQMPTLSQMLQQNPQWMAQFIGNNPSLFPQLFQATDTKTQQNCTKTENTDNNMKTIHEKLIGAFFTAALNKKANASIGGAEYLMDPTQHQESTGILNRLSLSINPSIVGKRGKFQQQFHGKRVAASGKVEKRRKISKEPIDLSLNIPQVSSNIRDTKNVSPGKLTTVIDNLLQVRGTSLCTNQQLFGNQIQDFEGRSRNKRKSRIPIKAESGGDMSKVCNEEATFVDPKQTAGIEQPSPSVSDSHTSGTSNANLDSAFSPKCVSCQELKCKLDYSESDRKHIMEIIQKLNEVVPKKNLEECTTEELHDHFRQFILILNETTRDLTKPQQNLNSNA